MVPVPGSFCWKSIDTEAAQKEGMDITGKYNY
jgi:hypothetical protein